MTVQVAALQTELSTLKDQHQVQLSEVEEKLKRSLQKVQSDQDAAHREEIAALTQEWNNERKVMESTLSPTNCLNADTFVSC